jgi:transcription elongation factor Elf1
MYWDDETPQEIEENRIKSRLNPCPLCGEDASVRAWVKGDYKNCTISCPDCSLEISSPYTDVAIDMWNRLKT